MNKTQALEFDPGEVPCKKNLLQTRFNNEIVKDFIKEITLDMVPED